MVPKQVQALFTFIDYLESNKGEYIKRYIPLCDEITKLDIQRAELKPKNNYKDKRRYDEIQKEIEEKFEPITDNIYLPVLNKLKELEIWAGDSVFTSIWNKNIGVIHDFKENFTSEDIFEVNTYKQRYLNFRKETNSNFLCLQFVFSNLDEIYKELFDFFKDTDENEFESFETKTIEVNNIKDIVKSLKETKGKNVRFSLPQESLFNYQNVRQYHLNSHNIKNEIIMGDKIQVGDITGNSGEVVIGKNIHISDTSSGKNETVEKITELVDLFRIEQNIRDEERQLLIEYFDNIKEEVIKETPEKSKVFQWLSKAKGMLENLVLTHDITEAIHWVYKNLNFIIH